MGRRHKHKHQHNLHLVPKKVLAPAPEVKPDVPEVREDVSEPDPKVDLAIAVNTEGLTIEDIFINGIQQCEKNRLAAVTIVYGGPDTVPQIFGNCSQARMMGLFALGYNTIKEGGVVEEHVVGKEN